MLALVGCAHGAVAAHLSSKQEAGVRFPLGAMSTFVPVTSYKCRYPKVRKKNRRMNPENSIVVVSRHEKPVSSWTRKLVENGFRVLVYDHEAHDGHPYFVPVNNGREASVYLKYIIDYYEHLPTFTIFLQDEDKSWHHEGSIVERVLDRVGRRSKYHNLNSKCLGIVRGIDLWPTMKSFFRAYLEPYIGSIEQYGEFTPGFRCCAQFVVHRDRIRQHPLRMYESLLRYTLREPPRGTPNPEKARGHMLEWTWHLIFDNPLARYNNDTALPSRRFRRAMAEREQSILKQTKESSPSPPPPKKEKGSAADKKEKEKNNKKRAELNGCEIL